MMGADHSADIDILPNVMNRQEPTTKSKPVVKQIN